MRLAAQVKRFIEQHGFDAFINSDDSVSFWIPTVHDKLGDGWILATARNLTEARIELGY